MGVAEFILSFNGKLFHLPAIPVYVDGAIDVCLIN